LSPTALPISAALASDHMPVAALLFAYNYAFLNSRDNLFDSHNAQITVQLKDLFGWDKKHQILLFSIIGLVESEA